MIFHDVQQASQEWFKLRLGVPTASEFDKIFTAKTCKLSKSMDRYAEQLIGETLSLFGPDRPESFTSRAMQWGQECESQARRFYCLERNVDVSNGGFCTTDDGRFGASPDALVGEDGCVEIKCPQSTAHCGYVLNHDRLLDDYRQQVHGELIVTGRQWVDILSYHAGMDPVLIRVEPDKYTDEMRVALELFYARFQELLAKVRGVQEGVTV